MICCRNCFSLSVLHVLNEICAVENLANGSHCSTPEAICFCKEPLRNTVVCKEIVDISFVHLMSCDAEMIDPSGTSRSNFDHARVCVWGGMYCMYVCVCCMVVCVCVYFVFVCVSFVFVCVLCICVCGWVCFVWLCVCLCGGVYCVYVARRWLCFVCVSVYYVFVCVGGRVLCVCVCVCVRVRARAKHGRVCETNFRTKFEFFVPVSRMFEAEYFVLMAVSMKTSWFCVETFKGSTESLPYLRPSTSVCVCVCVCVEILTNYL